MGFKKEFLRVCFLKYGKNPHCGEQGVYSKKRSRALVDLRYTVEVPAGNHQPDLDDGVRTPVISVFDSCCSEPPPTILYFQLTNPITMTEGQQVNTPNGYSKLLVNGSRVSDYIRGMNNFSWKRAAEITTDRYFKALYEE